LPDGRSRKLTTIGKANLRLEPSMDSKAVGVVERGQEIAVRFWTFGDEVKGERIWYLTHTKGDPFKSPKHVWAASTEYRPS
jgi:hypothetical protein